MACDGKRLVQMRRIVVGSFFAQFSALYFACSQGGVTGDDGIAIPFYPQLASPDPDGMEALDPVTGEAYADSRGQLEYMSEYECTVFWNSNELASQSPDAGQVDGTLFLAARRTAEQFVDGQSDVGGLVGRRDGALVQLDRGVSGLLSTEDGSLDESFNGFVEVFPGFAYLNISFDVEALGGSFAVDSSNLVGATLSLQFSDNNTAQGQFEGHWKDEQQAEYFRLTFAHLRCTGSAVSQKDLSRVFDL